MASDAAADEFVVRVVPDVAGLEAEFDYSVPEAMRERVQVGTIVRITLNNRRVRGWVTAIGVQPPAGVRLLPINKVTGIGPNLEMLELAGWAAERWLGKRSFFLQTASPQRVVAQLPAPGSVAPSRESAGSVVIHQWGPANDPWPVLAPLLSNGPTLILTPTQRSAERWHQRLRDAGEPVAFVPEHWAQAMAGGRHVVGTRSAAFAPISGLSAVFVVDAHDDAFQSEASPTWNAIDVVLERARRRSIPVALVTPVPRSELLALGTLEKAARPEERAGWTPLHVVDLRHTDPRSGMYSPVLVELLRSDKRVVCVMNRKGRAQLLVCNSCDEVARCLRCQGAMAVEGEDLRCRRCETSHPLVCANCGSRKFKQLRPGVARVREDLESLALRPVGEVTGDNDGLPDAEVLVGTEAVLRRVGRADAVAFLDFDQELMASRFRAAEDALVLLARASRITGGRKSNGIVVVQTRQPESEVIAAALHGDPERLSSVEGNRRLEMGWPPFGALASVSGKGAEDLISRLPSGIAVMGPRDGRYLLRADRREILVSALTNSYKSSVKTRIEFDPPRV